MLSRENLRKIASLGRQLLVPKVHSRRRDPESDGLGARRIFLTLLWTHLLQKNNLLDGNSLRTKETVSELGALLKHIPHPTQGEAWSFLDDSFAPGPAEEFREALKMPEFEGVWQYPESVGWAYQYFLEPNLEVFRSPSGPKIHRRHLAMRTQQFTPRWIADFLVQNTLGQLWLQMHPDSRIGALLPYLAPESSPLPPVTMKPVNEISILDPACGTMHLGLPAIELLQFIYREEMDQAGRTGWPTTPSVACESDIGEAIIQNNLFGVDIDPLAVELATLTLFAGMKGTLRRAPRLLCLDTLSRRQWTSRDGFPGQFDILLLNPPYLDKRDYNLKLKAYMASRYKSSGRNLYTAFLERSLDFLRPGGRLGAVTPQTFMFIRSFAELRKLLIDQTVIETLVHTGLNTFDDATVDCAFYVLRREPDDAKRTSERGRYLQITAPTSPEDKHTQMRQILDELHQSPTAKIPCCYTYGQSDFSALPDHPWVYWISPRIRELFRKLPALGDVAELRQGLATTDNERFLRYWWEIPHDRVAWNCRDLNDAASSGKKWFPYMKGGGYVKWYGCREFLVNWGQNGREIKEEICRRYPYLRGSWRWVAKNSEFYFREGITYSYLTSGKFSARYSPAGSIFDVAGSSVFCDNLWMILAILNSRWCRFALGLINPTVNFQVGDLKRLPVPKENCPTKLRHRVLEAIDLARSMNALDEISPDFVSPPPWLNGDRIIAGRNRRLMEIQQEVDQSVYQLYGLEKEDQDAIERQTSPDGVSFTMDRKELAYRWISYAMGTVFGRFSQPSTPPVLMHPLVMDDHEGLAGEVRAALEKILGMQAAREVIETVSPSCPLHKFLVESFFDWHFRQYQHRPIYWLLRQNNQLLVLYYPALDSERLDALIDTWSLKRLKADMPFDPDDGVRANMRPFRHLLAINAWKKAIE